MPIYAVGNNTGNSEAGTQWDLDISVYGVEVGYNFTYTDTNIVSIIPLLGYNIANVTQENKFTYGSNERYYDTLENNFRKGYTNVLFAVLLNYTFK